MPRLTLTYANVVSTFALAIAVTGGGVAYAASKAPKNSVTSSAIVNRTIKAVDVKNHAIGHNKLAHGVVRADSFGGARVGVVRAYAWMGFVATSTTLTGTQTFNPTGGDITTTHNGTGSYAVKFAGLDFTAGGIFQVTSSNGFAEYCDATAFTTDTVFVHCFDGSGADADGTFYVAYIR